MKRQLAIKRCLCCSYFSSLPPPPALQPFKKPSVEGHPLPGHLQRFRVKMCFLLAGAQKGAKEPGYIIHVPNNDTAPREVLATLAASFVRSPCVG